MKYILFSILSFTGFFVSTAQQQKFVSDDINNFWTAFDRVSTTNDSSLKAKYLNDYYFAKATPGLQSLIQVRNYSVAEYLNSFSNYPKFWSSLRANSLKTKSLYPEIESDINKLREFYPSLKPATIYFSVGAFRTNGTIQHDRVLIGVELALADENTVIDEHPDFRKNFYRQFKPKKNLSLLCTHEYIHTQQISPSQNLLTLCLYEGAAEFISCLVTEKRSTVPAIEFGKANHDKVVEKFVGDIFFNRLGDWLWGENSNELRERDLGYFIGYEICRRYYHSATDKQKAIKDLIELDYANDREVERIVDESKLFPATISQLREAYDKKRPIVLRVEPLGKNATIHPGSLQLVINFSEEMDINFRGFDYGPLGENHIYRFKKLIGWSDDHRSLTLEVEVDPGKKYQTLITSTFRNKQGIRLMPFLIEFDTGE